MRHRRRSAFVPTIVICGGLLVSACGLPPAIAIASYAATGFSYLTSGKSVSDHALSAMTEKDCALFRVVMGEDICREQSDQPADGVVIASADGSKPWRIEPAAGSAGGGAASNDGSGDYFDNTLAPPAAMLAEAGAPSLKGLLLQGLALGTEIFALMQDDGALEIYAHDPSLVDAPENITMILKLDDYKQKAHVVEGVRLNGKFYAIKDILV